MRPPALATLTMLLLSMPASPAVAIVGPSSDAAADAPHVVMILNRQGRTAGFCSGVVLAGNVVLTAAHCVPKGAELRVHYPDPDPTPVMVRIADVVRHPEFRADAIQARARSIDLALLRLDSPLPDRFRPVALSMRGEAGLGEPFVVEGYGVTREGEGASSGRLRETTLRARAPLSRVLLWAEDPARSGAGACTGDSGGPVRAEKDDRVTALTLWSAGDKSAHCGALTQALWLAPHRAWIERVMQSWGAAGLR